MSYFLEVKNGERWIRTVYQYYSESVARKQLMAVRKEDPSSEFRMVLVTHNESVMEW